MDYTDNNDDDITLTIIVGRGRDYSSMSQSTFLNLPLSNNIRNRPNTLYVDDSKCSNPDLHMKIEDVDFKELKHKYTDVFIINIYFDWATFYCTAMHNTENIFKNILDAYEDIWINIYVPMYPDENVIPADVKRAVNVVNIGAKMLLVHDEFPLFDWTDVNRLKDIKYRVNQTKYILIQRDNHNPTWRTND